MAKRKHSINSYGHCYCHGHGAGEGQLGCTQTEVLTDSQPCPLRTQWLSRHTVHTHATSPSCLSRTPIHHAPKGSHRPRHQNPSWPRDVSRSPPASHFLRQAWFSYSQEREDPCGQLFIAGAWGTPNWGYLCFLAQHPLLRERHGYHQPLANSSLARPSPEASSIHTPFPLLLTLHVSPSPEGGQEKKATKINTCIL